MIYVLIILSLIILILWMPIGIRITKNDKRSDVDIFLSKIFNTRIDFDEFIRFLLTTKDNRKEITVSSISHNLRLVYAFRDIILKYLRLSTIRKLTYIMKGKFEDLETQTYFEISSRLFIVYFHEYLNRLFKEVNNTYFSVRQEPSTIKTMFVLECVIDIRLIYFIMAIFKMYHKSKRKNINANVRRSEKNV